MVAYSFLAGMAFLVSCFGLNEVKVSKLKTRAAK